MERIIGKKRFPIDNSRSFTIGREEHCPYLAGTWNTPAKKVLIVSEPYKIYIPEWNDQYDFVTVFYNNECHVILNIFTKEQPYYERATNK